MDHEQQQKKPERSGVVILLAHVAGFVDGVGYLVLFHMFTSHMSGNTIAGGVDLGTAHWLHALRRLFPLPAFVTGVVLGRLLVEFLGLRGHRSPFAAAFCAEALLLLLFLCLGSPLLRDGELQPDSAWIYYALAALPAVAMGFQNATLRRVGGQTVRTTYITGGLTDLADGVIDYLYWLCGRRMSKARPSLGGLALLGVVWLCYFLGAILGALAEQRWQLICLLLPIACLLLLAVVDVIRPYSRPSSGDEKEDITNS